MTCARGSAPGRESSSPAVRSVAARDRSRACFSAASAAARCPSSAATGTAAALRATLVAAAHADGIIRSEEVAGMETLYKALGLDPALVYSDIHAGDVPGGPVPVKPATAGTPGEAIPA